MKRVVFCTFVKIVNSCYQIIVRRDNPLSLQMSSGDFKSYLYGIERQQQLPLAVNSQELWIETLIRANFYYRRFET